MLALLPNSKTVLGLCPAWGTVDTGGHVLPRPISAQMRYLPSLAVWSLHVLQVLIWDFPIKNPTIKLYKIRSLFCPVLDHRHNMSSWTWSPVAAELTSLRAVLRGRTDLRNTEKKFLWFLDVCVCVKLCDNKVPIRCQFNLIFLNFIREVSEKISFICLPLLCQTIPLVSEKLNV